MKHEHFWVMCAAASTALVIIGGAATAALAQQRSPITTVVGERSEEGRSMRVSYRDLNLAAAHDRRVLNRRVGGAVTSVCTPDYGYNEPVDAVCAHYAWHGARPQIALAVQRAQEIAQLGSSSIPLMAIAISVH